MIITLLPCIKKAFMTVFFIAFSLEEEFWLGLENIYELTQVKNYTLRVTMETFEGIIKTAFYTDFKLLDNVSKTLSCSRPMAISTALRRVTFKLYLILPNSN